MAAADAATAPLPRLFPREGDYAVCRLPPGSPVEAPTSASFYALTRTAGETSLVCLADAAPPPGAEVKVERGWRLVEVEGPLAFSQIGVLAAIAAPLAAAAVSIFVVSTFDTDYLMVREESWAAARRALTDAGYELACPPGTADPVGGGAGAGAGASEKGGLEDPEGDPEPAFVAWPLYQANAFVMPKQGLSGNPAGVCLIPPESARPVPGPVSDDVLQAIAAEVNLSETAFLEPLPADTDGEESKAELHPSTASRFRLRWFTPKNEVPLCGHGTMGAAGALFYAIGNKSASLTFDTLSGPLICEKAGAGGVMMKFPRNLSRVAEYNEAQQAVVEAITRCILGDVPVTVETVLYAERTHKCMLMLAKGATREHLAAIVPDTKGMEAVDQTAMGADDIRGVSVCLQGAAEDECDFLSRYFNPWFGIDEDPVNGTTHTTLTPYWSERLGKKDLVARMCSWRPGRLVLRDDPEGDSVMMGGEVYCSRSGHINLPMSLFKK